MSNEPLFPFQMNLLKVKRVLPQKQDCLTILFVIQGNVTVYVNGETIKLLPDDVYLVNPSDEYQLISEESNLILNLQISREKIEFYLKKNWYPKFACYSDIGNTTVEKSRQFKKIREILVHLMVAYFKENPEYEFEVNQYLFSLLSYLVKEFQEKTETFDLPIKNITDEKVLRIVGLINQNYSQPISLERVAQDEFISYSHLSRSFKKNMGMTFTEYVNQVRLMHAAEELKTTKQSVLKIALNNGFANAKIFHKVFRKKFGETPMNYRKMHDTDKRLVIASDEVSLFTEQKGEQALQELSKYLVEKDIADENAVIKETNEFSIDSTYTYTTCYRQAKKIINIGPIIEGSGERVQKELSELQRELHFDLIQFTGFFQETEVAAPNRILSDYVLNNYWFDFLQEINLIPMVQLILPKGIETRQEVHDWCLNQLDLVKHFINRYSSGVVTQWYFEWVLEAKGENTLEQEAYLFFQKQIKSILPKSKVGFLTLTSLSTEEIKEMQNYFQIVRNNQCFPDFLTFHADPTILANDLEHTMKQKIDFQNYHRDSLKIIQKTVEAYDFPAVEIFMTDWNTLVGEGDILAGTFFRSALILEVILELSNEISGIGFWLNIKIKERVTLKRQDHCLSVFLYGKLKRPLYFAMFFLQKIGQEIIETGPGYMLTKEGEEVQLLVYNPCYIKPLYSVNNFLVQNQTKHWTIRLKGLIQGDYLVRHYSLDKDHGGIYNDWLRVGGYKELDQELIEHLEKKIMPKFELLKEPVEGGIYQFTTDLTINACQLYCLKPLL